SWWTSPRRRARARDRNAPSRAGEPPALASPPTAAADAGPRASRSRDRERRSLRGAASARVGPVHGRAAAPCRWPPRRLGEDPLGRRAVLEQKLLDESVAVLPCCVDRAEAAALFEVRVGSVLERELDELVARLL